MALLQDNQDVLRMFDSNRSKYTKIAAKEANKRVYSMKHVGHGNVKSMNNVSDATFVNHAESVQNMKKKRRRFIKRNRFRRKAMKKKRQKITLIHNYSSLELTKPMISLLERGLNFAVTPKTYNLSEVLVDFSKFERKIKWREYWHDKGDTNDTYEPPIFRKEKTNMPKNTSKEVEGFVSGIRSEIIGTPPNQVFSNITPDEKNALTTLINLQRNREIIIISADKGGGIVIMDFPSYMKSCIDHLQDKTPDDQDYYKKSTEADLRNAKLKITSVLKEGLSTGSIDQTEFTFLDPKERGPGKFYQIMKVHKEHDENQLPPGRPIISGTGSITEQISYFVDYHAKELVKNVPSYIQDTPDFLRHLDIINRNENLPSEAVPISIDVKGLYTNIPIDEGIQIFHDALNERSEKKVSSGFLTKLLSLVLNLNIFEFDDELFVQCFGTAMGTRVAPTFANLFMANIDQKIRDAAEKYKTTTNQSPLKMFKRFIDDLFVIWIGAPEDLVNFLDDLNKIHPTIKFTASYDLQEKSTNFLDTTVNISNGKLHTDLYRKKTDRIKYLLPSSCHPSHICNNIPYSLGLRIVRICSDEEKRNMRLQELKEMLIGRCYRRKIVDNALDEVKSVKREDALKRVEKKKNERITFALTYYPHLPPISRILNRHWKALTSDSYFLKMYPEPPMVAFKKLPNLKQQLIHTKLPKVRSRSQPRMKKGLKKCLKSRCQICPYLVEHQSTKSRNSNAESILDTVVSCDSTHVVYLISCNKCRALYIGETERTLQKRISEHLSYIDRDVEATGKHFNSKGHTKSDVRVQVLEKVIPSTKAHLQVREKYWIQEFSSRYGPGLNKKS